MACLYHLLIGMQVSLATSFEGMNLLEDAQLQCEELEVSFFQVLRERNLSWFGKLLDLKPGDDTLPLLSLQRKPYRDLMLSNTISVFDYRVYLLALQCLCLGKAGRVADAARKAANFLSGFGRRLRESPDPLPEYFIEAWTYASCLSVIQQCETWAEGVPLDATAAASFNSAKGELYDLARMQVERIGILHGHLPDTPPFATSIDRTTPPVAADLKISCEPVLHALASREEFYRLYMAATNRTIASYDKGGRRKFGLRLHGCAAALDLLRGRNSNAHQTYASLPSHYSHNNWTSLEALVLRKALDTHDEEKPRGRSWVDAALGFLRTLVTLHPQNVECEYVEKVIAGLRDACADAESDVITTNHPAVVLSLKTTDARQADEEDGSFIDVTVKNGLPCDLPGDHVVVTFLGAEGRKFEYATAAAVVFSPGENQLTLFCAVSLLLDKFWC